MKLLVWNKKCMIVFGVADREQLLDMFLMRFSYVVWYSIEYNGTVFIRIHNL